MKLSVKGNGKAPIEINIKDKDVKKKKEEKLLQTATFPEKFLFGVPFESLKNFGKKSRIPRLFKGNAEQPFRLPGFSTESYNHKKRDSIIHCKSPVTPQLFGG